MFILYQIFDIKARKFRYYCKEIMGKFTIFNYSLLFAIFITGFRNYLIYEIERFNFILNDNGV